MKGDKCKIILFLGAGASIDAGVSGVKGLVNELLAMTDTKFDKNVTKAVNEVISFIKENRAYKKYPVNIEEILEVIERLETKDNDILLQSQVILKSKFKTFFKIQKVEHDHFFSDLVKRSISISTSKSEIKVDYLKPILNIIRDFKPLNVFSTNYDICIERFCSLNALKYYDGFNHEWKSNFYGRDEEILLYKLHGSITWSRSERGKYTRNEIAVKEPFDPQVNNVTTGDVEIPLILYPGKKLEYNEPGFDLLHELKNQLNTVDYVFVIGYSFRDEHIRKLFHYAASKNSGLILILIDPSAYNIYYGKIEYLNDPEFSRMTKSRNRIHQHYESGRFVCRMNLRKYYHLLRKNI